MFQRRTAKESISATGRSSTDRSFASRFFGSRAKRWTWLAMLATLLVVAWRLYRQGRTWWCSCGSPDLWWGDIHSAHCSQHLLDPYSFTHVLHGLAFCGLLAWIVPRLSPWWRLWLAVLVESLWEVFENSEFVIQRYRAATIALGYEGDSILNSLADILCCAGGFILAHRLGLRGSIALFVLTELVLLVWIRDNLSLNIIMLICPIDAIKTWQSVGGGP